MEHRIDPENMALLIVDWQERLCRAMPAIVRDQALGQATNLKWLAEQLDIPVLVSEQYPRGLGPTVLQLRQKDAIEKLTFSAMGADELAKRLRSSHRTQVVLVGMETHVCVAQTCRDLIEHGYVVWVAADACLSRRKLDWEYGLERMRRDGALLTTTESILFELIQSAEHKQFKALSKRIR